MSRQVGNRVTGQGCPAGFCAACLEADGSYSAGQTSRGAMGEGTMAEDGREARWHQLMDEVQTGMREWRTAHPTASFAEIEAAVDERLAGVRARMLEAAALASRAADIGGLAAAERPQCPDCGQPLVERGRHTRTLTAVGDQAVQLERSYAVCPSCGRGLFPPG